MIEAVALSEQGVADLAAAERAMVARSLRYYLSQHVRILEPAPSHAVIPYTLWPHLASVADALETYRRLIWLKARQLGASWSVAAYALREAMYRPPANVLLLSQGQQEAIDLLGKCALIYDQLPPHLREPLERRTTQELVFGGLSRIRALPSTPDAGRSETASLVILDEADYHPYLAETYAAITPTIDAGGQLVILSTSNSTSTDSAFKRLWRGAPSNGLHPLFYGWDARPGRTGEWYETTRRAALDPGAFAHEYPATAGEALAPPASLAAFDVEALTAMRADVRTPVETWGNGAAAVWQRYAVGRRYVAGTDAGHGVGADNSVTVVMDAQTGYVVAHVLSRTLDVEALTRESLGLLERYQRPVWAIEGNDPGPAVLALAERAGYPRLYHRETAAGKEGPMGWFTDARTRPVLWADLQAAVKDRLLVVPSEEGLAQFAACIRNPERGGRIEAAQGANDDYPMAVGIAWQVRGLARPEAGANGATRPVRYKYG